MRQHLKDYFIPHKKNNHKPYLLRGVAFTFVVTLCIGVLGVFSLYSNVLFTRFDFLASVLPGVLVDLTNVDRNTHNLSTLKTNEVLTLAAQLKVNDMAEKGYFAHTSPEGLTPWHWFEQAGYDFVYAGENLAVNFNDSDKVLEAWMASPSHRDNILNKHFTEIGIATAEGVYKGKQTTFAVQLFGRPAQKQIEVLGVAEVAPEPEKKLVVLATAGNTHVSPEEPVFVSVENPEEKIVEEETSGNVEGSSGVDVGTLTQESDLTDRLATQPSKVAYLIYATIGFIVLVVLTLTICINIRVQHKRNILYGIILLLVICAILWLALPQVASQVIVT